MHCSAAHRARECKHAVLVGKHDVITINRFPRTLHVYQCKQLASGIKLEHVAMRSPFQPWLQLAHTQHNGCTKAAALHCSSWLILHHTHLIQYRSISFKSMSGAAVPSFGQNRAPPSRSSSFGSDAGGGGAAGAFYPSQAPPTPGGPRPMGRAPAFGAQQGGFSQPGGAGSQLPPSYGPAQSQAVLDQFEALTLGPAAPGQPGDSGMHSAVTHLILEIWAQASFTCAFARLCMHSFSTFCPPRVGSGLYVGDDQ